MPTIHLLVDALGRHHYFLAPEDYFVTPEHALNVYRLRTSIDERHLNGFLEFVMLHTKLFYIGTEYEADEAKTRLHCELK